MKPKLVLIAITAFLILLFIGCDVDPVEYDRVRAQLSASQSQATELQRQINELKEQYELVGGTPTETAENIVKHYHETHIYSEYDFFVCSDMALDVWDMLKAQGINALIQIGNVKIEAENITAADHAWVLAEVSQGEYLALETTGGYLVWGDDNLLYYKGWSFDNPKEYKRYVELRQEYNTRVTIVEQMGKTFEASRNAALESQAKLLSLAARVSSMSLFDPLLSSQLAEIIEEAEEYGEYIGRCNQLTELVSQQNQELENIISEMRGLTQ